MKTKNNKIFGFISLFITFLPLIALTVYAQKSYKSSLRPNIIHRIEVYNENNRHHAIIFARGKGKIAEDNKFKAKSRFMAKRAAKLDGYRKLLIGINQSVTPHTGITYVEGFLKGTALYDERENAEKGIIETDVVLFIDLDPDYIKTKRKAGVFIENIDKAKYQKEKNKVQFIDKKEWQNLHTKKHL
ncbi:hypothetical protein J7L67_09245 [bacterium]|nr:hypothetical protein [bacterium]